MSARSAIAIGLLTAAALSACGSSSGTSATPTSPAAASGPVSWTVDTSGWWVPDDPTGCLQETVTCHTSAWKTRALVKGNTVINIIQHGEKITLLCKAPVPSPIRNSLKTEGVWAYYIEWQGENYWMPDIYVAKDDAAVQAMAQGVPDCASNTPGINGPGS